MQRIAFDIIEMRPGCAIIQAIFGCDSLIAHQFPAESWLVAPTPNMRCYPITNEQLSLLVAMVEAKLKEGKRIDTDGIAAGTSPAVLLTNESEVQNGP